MIAPKPENIGFYAKEVKSVIPKEAFKPASYKLVIMFLYLAIAIGCFYYIRITPSWGLILLLSSIAGVLFSGLFMFCHEFSHGTIVKKKIARNILQIFFWSFNYMPATMWRRIHHQTHHLNANNYKDPDRRPFKSEKSFVNKILNTLTYPNKVLKFSFTVGFAMPVYTWKHIASVYYPEGKKPSTVLYKPDYSNKEKRNIALEVFFIILIQIAIALIIASPIKYLITTLISWYVSSLFTVLVIMTQHYLRPNYSEGSDPLMTTTTTEVPKLMDLLMDYHSYHVEHHIIPAINFDYYPIVARELKKKIPDKYHSLPFLTAVKQAFDYETFVDDPLE
jgi:fatty acid desaturase